jgi:hypothetical protein
MYVELFIWQNLFVRGESDQEIEIFDEIVRTCARPGSTQAPGSRLALLQCILRSCSYAYLQNSGMSPLQFPNQDSAPKSILARTHSHNSDQWSASIRAGNNTAGKKRSTVIAVRLFFHFQS